MVFLFIVDIKMSTVPMSAAYVKHMSAVLKQKMESGDFTEEKESCKLQEAVTQQRPLYDSFLQSENDITGFCTGCEAIFVHLVKC